MNLFHHWSTTCQTDHFDTSKRSRAEPALSVLRNRTASSSLRGYDKRSESTRTIAEDPLAAA
jgi:hypothetical protein